LAKKIEKQPREYTKRQLSHAKKAARRQKIYLFSGIGVIVVVIILALSGWLFGEYLPMNKTIVTVGGDTIKEKDLIDTAVLYSQFQSGTDITQQLDYILQTMIQNLIIKQEASNLGYTVSKQELSDALKSDTGKPSQAYKDLVSASLLSQKLRKEYFDKQVPDSGNQVLMNAMLVESSEVAEKVRAQVLAGDNFTKLVNQYAVNKVSKDNGGIFDWHPQDILNTTITSSIPADWAFSENVTKGMVSDPLSDNVSTKQLGYWLIKVDEPVTKGEGSDSSANISAILLASEAQAIDFRAQLEAGADLGTMADAFSQYSPSKEAHGNWVVAESSNISTPFNSFAFDPNTKVGEWSQPIKDTLFWTTGGDWIVQLVDKSTDHPYSAADKSTLIDKLYSNWSNALWTSSSSNVKDTFADAERAQAISKINARVGKK